MFFSKARTRFRIQLNGGPLNDERSDVFSRRAWKQDESLALKTGTVIADAKAAAAKSWFGYGRWDAKFWFICIEPSGDDGNASYEAWHHIGGAELDDCRAHHLWKREVLGLEDLKWTRATTTSLVAERSLLGVG